jgi:toxin-antitoxin system PIN domain toxin
VIVLDANLLLYAYVPELAHHQQARRWLARTFIEEPLVGMPWQSVSAFLRVATNPRLSAGVSVEELLSLVDSWLQLPNVRLLAPGEHHWTILRRTILESQVRASKLTDAQLAALTIEHGGTLYTTDRDFARFPGLRWTNPLSV